MRSSHSTSLSCCPIPQRFAVKTPFETQTFILLRYKAGAKYPLPLEQCRWTTKLKVMILIKTVLSQISQNYVFARHGSELQWEWRKFNGWSDETIDSVQIWCIVCIRLYRSWSTSRAFLSWSFTKHRAEICLYGIRRFIFREKKLFPCWYRRRSFSMC